MCQSGVYEDLYGKARWALCMDKFSKISPNMFGLQQAFTQKVKICSDCTSGLKKPKFVRTGQLGLKKIKFVQIGPKRADFARIDSK
jgi:hypothetical protein